MTMEFDENSRKHLFNTKEVLERQINKKHIRYIKLKPKRV